MNKILFSTIALLLTIAAMAQHPRIPASYNNLAFDANGKLYFENKGGKYFTEELTGPLTIEQFLGKAKGNENGVMMDFGTLKGTVTYGLIPYGKAPHPLPVYRKTLNIENGNVTFNIKDDFKYPYDFVDWKKNGYLNIGYRIANDQGMILFDGIVALKGEGPFEVTPAIYEGPFVNMVTDNSAVIWCRTTHPVKAEIEINGKVYKDEQEKTLHRWDIAGLAPHTKYSYKVSYGIQSQSYHLKTAPKKGSREAFVFGYSSDSRHATGGGERKILGANAYIMKKIAALAYMKDASFIQFTGDMINGYLSSKEQQRLEYYNWKKSIEPFWHYMPFYIGMGNHEALGFIFKDEKGKQQAFIDAFPYDTQSAEALFAEEFVNPENGPGGEDNNKYDPDPQNIDFPSYKENVYYYTYGNVAMIVLNSNYWYAPSIADQTATGGGLHGYLMDNQLLWLQQTLEKLEADTHIDHIFVTQHTPAFPNGGHSKDDMWYSGDNSKRPYIAGKPVEKGIIERRDEYLDLLINKSRKVVGMLTGDEHNYNWLKLTADMPIYPDNYPHKKLKVSRPVYQINNGAAGAPYYGQEVLPWSKHTQSFSVENALCLFYIEGKKITMKVFNPDTLNQIDEVELR
ncbi:metallophosphoesterase [Flavobacterium sp.]|uniref:metallophosphoesterase family protein n=1 Tax=Flavobacterium sp. TaxID=239 RepID=UPI002639B70D|nr:metallophosphoesterase [Flavobacterium sp.]